MDDVLRFAVDPVHAPLHAPEAGQDAELLLDALAPNGFVPVAQLAEQAESRA